MYIDRVQRIFVGSVIRIIKCQSSESGGHCLPALKCYGSCFPSERISIRCWDLYFDFLAIKKALFGILQKS